MPGVGKTLGLTIILDARELNRFKRPGNYSSYCRTVSLKRISNGKKEKTIEINGNKYLSWAFTETSIFIIRYLLKAQKNKIHKFTIFKSFPSIFSK